MEFIWIKTKYGHELIESYSENQAILLKYDPDGMGEYYISCINCHDTGRIYLNSNSLEESKKLAIEELIDRRKDEIKDIQSEIEELNNLIN